MLVRRFWALCDLHSIKVQMDYVRSAENPADATSRWKFTDEWKLSPAVFAAMEREFRVKHTIDLFASRNCRQTERYVSAFPDGRSVAVDAFSLESWAGEVAWVNCDWDLLEKVAQRLVFVSKLVSCDAAGLPFGMVSEPRRRLEATPAGSLVEYLAVKMYFRVSAEFLELC